MVKGAPDYSKMVLLQALDSNGNLIPVLLDATGKLIAILQGIDASAVLRTLKVDANGQIIAVIKGSGGENITVDANGFLSAVMKGAYGSELKSIAVDSSGNMKAVLQGASEVSGTVNANDTNTVKQIQGTDGAVYRTALVDSSGRFIMVPRGNSGYYMLVDASGYLASIMKGEKPDTSLGNVAIDASGQIIMVPRGQSGNYMNVDASGYLTSVMKGIEGATLRTIAVDASGNIIGLLKGDYQGTLKTFSCDADGRLLAKIYDPQNVFGVNAAIGLAELANRIQAPLMYDKRGEVAWYDDFEAAILKWYTTNMGGSDAVISTTRPYLGEQSVYLAVTAGAGYFSLIQKSLQVFQTARMGMELKFSWNAIVNNPTFIIRIIKYTGSNRYEAAILISPFTYNLFYLNTSNAWVSFGSKACDITTASHWYACKIVVDFSTSKYVRFQFGDTEYDLSANAIYTTTDTGLQRNIYSIELWGAATSSGSIYIDDVIMTVNEN